MVKESIKENRRLLNKLIKNLNLLEDLDDEDLDDEDLSTLKEKFSDESDE